MPASWRSSPAPRPTAFCPRCARGPRPHHGGGARPPPRAPGGVVFFGRDMESSRQVWSAETGYPGDCDYREFYKDVGWELPAEYLADFLPDGQRKNLGLQHHRVTGPRG